MRRLLIAIFLVFAGWTFMGLDARANEVDDFTARLAKEFGKIVSADKVKIVGPLVIDVTAQSGPHRTYLENVWSACRRSPETCEDTIANFVENMAEAQNESGEAATPAAIRAVVRTESYIASTRKVSDGHPELAVVAEPLAGDLWLLCVVDHPHGVGLLNHRDLARLKLSEDQAIQLGLDNLAKGLPPLESETKTVADAPFSVVAGDYYDSSRVLLHESWTEISSKLHGHLVVAAPATDMLVYGEGRTKAQIAAIREVANYAAAKAPKPISPTLLHWTKTGWRVVKPREAAEEN